jgi:hypothetical protein
MIPAEYNECFPENVTKLAHEFFSILEKYYPEITSRTYDSFGYPDREGNPALTRIRFCIYIELMKAGAFNDCLRKEE